ncbi:O-antigen ligase family protein [Sinanaerobacter chloroacetimidivorans]|uniref:O-antigen ligase family protein n=1 Tax=Sinanaerobacter chloroacetimidivorans TaxID=2818044 RepID=A0A8J8B1X6_9FIRM|nr:O-antigen ligase family protein [Sinanaerobacter chloroacetimidivorans]MBR0598192.1 O-antigen ligase family protein [Sinanaerobacter chloroacetimidivorans]
MVKSKQKNLNIIKKYKIDNKTGRYEITKMDFIKLLPVILFSAVVILITRMKVYPNPVQEFWWNQQGGYLTDFFSYYKMWAILIVAAAAICIFTALSLRKTIRIKPESIYIPIAVYSALVIISHVFSDYREFALLGWEDRFEGTLVLLAYMVMLFYVINIVNHAWEVKVIIYSVLTASCILGLLGLSQGIGHDLLASDFGKKLIIPHDYWQYLDQVIFYFNKNEIYQTVYNINYVSFYLTLIIPLAGMLFLTSEKASGKVVFGLIFSLLVYNMFGAASSGGILGLLISMLIAVIIIGERILRRKKEIAVLIVITAVLALINVGTLAPELFNATRSIFTGKAEIQSHEISNDEEESTDGYGEIVAMESAQRPRVEFIETNKDSVMISVNGAVIEFKLSDDTNSFNQRYDFLKVNFALEGEDEYLLVSMPDMVWPFLISDSGLLYRTSYGSLVDLRQVETFGFKGKEGFGSGRGYIWSRSLPLVKGTLIWGNGADTFAAYFPQDDFAGKYTGPSFSRDIDSVIRKPHSMYLGTAINTGLVSLIALVALFAIYVKQSVKIYRKEKMDSFVKIAGFGIFLGICGFLADGLVYDSNVCVMPLFYSLLGVGIAINRLITKKS